MSNPFDSVRALEADLCAYTGARYAVAVNSCTMALLLACAWQKHRTGRTSMVFLPRLTYIGVPMSVHHAGHGVAFEDVDWQGEYELRAVPDFHGTVWDSARLFTEHMCRPYRQPDCERTGIYFQCVSFHISKILGDSQGGAILHNDPHADHWLRRARFDGRTEGVPPTADTFVQLGWHCYLSPDVATALSWKLSSLPRVNAPLPRSDYSDLSESPLWNGSALNQQKALAE